MIISYHNFSETPSYEMLWSIVLRARDMGAEIVKISTTANSQADNETLYRVLDTAREHAIRMLGMCMGEEGRESRVKALEHGGLWMFAALDESTRTADGQMTIDEVKSSINGDI